MCRQKGLIFSLERDCISLYKIWERIQIYLSAKGFMSVWNGGLHKHASFNPLNPFYRTIRHPWLISKNVWKFRGQYLGSYCLNQQYYYCIAKAFGKNENFVYTLVKLDILWFLLNLISASNGNCEAAPRTAEWFGVQTHYYRLYTYVTSDVCDQKCDSPTNAWVVRCLSWKTISVPWFGRDYWHGGRADNSNKRANNAKYSNCKGLNHETFDVSLQNLRSRPFWILSSLRILFCPFSVCLQAKHDSICA